MRLLLTGAHGFLGQAIQRVLSKRTDIILITPTSSEFNLCEQSQVRVLFDTAFADTVIHAAGYVGGIQANRDHPAEFLYKNLLMGTLVLEEAHRANIKRFLAVSSVCAYPLNASIPLHESSLWDGYPEETNSAYGLAKRMLVAQTEVYTKQYGMQAGTVLLANLYGENDHFDDSGHVIPMLIRKFIDAVLTNAPSVVVWGDGTPTREFLYVEDAARGIVKALESNFLIPINLGTGVETSILELVEIIKDLTHFQGKIVWDTSKPNGQPRRQLDVSYVRHMLGFQAQVSLCEGLERMIAWYQSRIGAT